jgi:hypothetical protein
MAIFFFVNFSDKCLGILVTEVDDISFFANFIFFCPLFLRLIGFVDGGLSRQDDDLILHMS